MRFFSQIAFFAQAYEKFEAEDFREGLKNFYHFFEGTRSEFQDLADRRPGNSSHIDGLSGLAKFLFAEEKTNEAERQFAFNTALFGLDCTQFMNLFGEVLSILYLFE